MYKGVKFFKILTLIMLASFLLVGCTPPWQDYDPDNDNHHVTPSFTFGITDVPYFEKDYQIPDKEVNKEYDLYLFITNKNKDKNDKDEFKYSAEKITITLVDETHRKTILVAENFEIPSGHGIIRNLSYPYEARVHFHVEGQILKRLGNGKIKEKVWAKSVSNSFNIGNPNATVEYITIEPSTKTIRVGETFSYTAKAKYKDRLPIEDVTDKVNWGSANPSIAIMNGKEATGMGIGETKIIASFQGKTAQATLTVKDPVSALKKITISPTNTEVLIGKNKAFTAFGEYANGNVLNITSLVTWVSTNDSVATIGEKSGVATGVSIGSTTITATYNGVSASANLVVKAPPTPIPDSERLIWEREKLDS